MEDFKKMFDEVYGWTVEDGKPTPPKQDLPQFVKDRADYFWEMAEDGLTLLGAMECIFSNKNLKNMIGLLARLGCRKRKNLTIGQINHLVWLS